MRPWAGLHTRSSLSASLARRSTNPLLSDAPTLSLSGSVDVSPGEKAFSSPKFWPLYRSPSARTSKALFSLAILQYSPDYDARFNFLQGEKTDLADALKKDSDSLKQLSKALTEETVAHSATVSTLGALERQTTVVRA